MQKKKTKKKQKNKTLRSRSPRDVDAKLSSREYLNLVRVCETHIKCVSVQPLFAKTLISLKSIVKPRKTHMN